MNKESWKKVVTVTIFAIAMAFLEAVIVIYLRKLYYPAGFNFPLSTAFETSIFNIEWLREIGTVVMLACIGWIAGKRFSERLAYFLYAFAIWDIFYYVWLLATLHWPSSFFTWDLLFLIPWPWAGPILAPVILSLTMILLAFTIIHFNDRKEVKLKLKERVLLIAGSLIILYTFLIDYGRLIFQNNYWKDFLNMAGNKQFLEAVGNFSPAGYNWVMFITGEVLILLSVLILYLRLRKRR